MPLLKRQTLHAGPSTARVKVCTYGATNSILSHSLSELYGRLQLCSLPLSFFFQSHQAQKFPQKAERGVKEQQPCFLEAQQKSLFSQDPEYTDQHSG